MSFSVTQPKSPPTAARVQHEVGPIVAHKSAAATQFVMRGESYDATEAVNTTVAV
jgi:hypothetical protein